MITKFITTKTYRPNLKRVDPERKVKDFIIINTKSIVYAMCILTKTLLTFMI